MPVTIILSLIFRAATIAFANSPEFLLPKYDALMETYPAKSAPLNHCVLPKVESNRQTHRYRTTLLSKFKESPPSPNFCGRYFVFNEPITGGGDLFLADCENGKIETLREEWASNGPYMKLSSCLLIEYPPTKDAPAENFHGSVYGLPRLYRWDGKRFVKLADPITKR